VLGYRHRISAHCRRIAVRASDQCFEKFLLIYRSFAVPDQCRAYQAWGSRLRLFHDEASNIGSQLIATTLLQQKNGVHRSAKKAVAHQGKDDPAQGAADDAPVEGVEPCLV
jgi:hypothetical protein